MPARSSVDVLVVSVPGTLGWRTGAHELTAALERAGARVVGAQARQQFDK